MSIVIAVRDKTTSEEMEKMSELGFYENLVIQCQMYGSRLDSPVRPQEHHLNLGRKELAYDQRIDELRRRIEEAECVVVGGASGLSAAGGGDFYYEDNASFRKYFGKYADKYHFKGAFDGMSSNRFVSDEDRWGYVATFLNTTINAPVREPYKDLMEVLKGKDFFVVTTNQDTQFVKVLPEEKVAEIQGDHRLFQCSRCCHDYTWDSVEPVRRMIEAMGDSTAVPKELIPRCPFCGAEAFPWVRGYGNFLEGKKYREQYQKISEYILDNKDRRILFWELGVGRMTPMFIQEPFWYLTQKLKDARYVSMNNRPVPMPKSMDDKGMVIVEDIAKSMRDLRDRMVEKDEPVQRDSGQDQ